MEPTTVTHNQDLTGRGDPGALHPRALPCKRCGNIFPVIARGDDDSCIGFHWVVTCPVCYVGGPIRDAEDAAVDAWNAAELYLKPINAGPTSESYIARDIDGNTYHDIGGTRDLTAACRVLAEVQHLAPGTYRVWPVADGLRLYVIGDAPAARLQWLRGVVVGVMYALARKGDE